MLLDPTEPTPEAWLAREFDRCWPWLEASLAIQPVRTHEREHVWAELQNGSSQLWPTVNSATLFSITVYPTGAKVFFGWLAGGLLSEVLSTTVLAEAYAREIGCDAFAVQGRRGWLRALDGFEDAGLTIVKDLR